MHQNASEDIPGRPVTLTTQVTWYKWRSTEQKDDRVSNVNSDSCSYWKASNDDTTDGNRSLLGNDFVLSRGITSASAGADTKSRQTKRHVSMRRARVCLFSVHERSSLVERSKISWGAKIRNIWWPLVTSVTRFVTSATKKSRNFAFSRAKLQIFGTSATFWGDFVRRRHGDESVA